jgi:hypothetical protein
MGLNGGNSGAGVGFGGIGLNGNPGGNRFRVPAGFAIGNNDGLGNGEGDPSNSTSSLFFSLSL